MPTLLTGENRWERRLVRGLRPARGERLRRRPSLALADREVERTDELRRRVRSRSPTTSNQPSNSRPCCTNGRTSNLDHESRSRAPRDVREVEAESVAYLLGQTIGLDSQAYSVPYIAGWAVGDLDLVETTAQQVLATTKQLVETLERDLGVKLTVDVLDHALPEADTNVIALPGSTPPNRPTPQDIAPTRRDPSSRQRCSRPMAGSRRRSTATTALMPSSSKRSAANSSPTRLPIW